LTTDTEREDAEAIRAFEKLRTDFPEYNSLTSLIDIRDRQAPNRVVHQPMECNDSPNGFPSRLTLERYKRLAEAHAGITVVEATSVGPESRARIHQLVADEEHSRGIAGITDVFKGKNNKTILCFQITHSGQISDGRFSEAVRVYKPSGFDAFPGRYLSAPDIDQIVRAFITAADIVDSSGADMVDVKLCHGYLGGQLIRPANTRPDEYGGSLDNRLRFAQRVIEGIRERCPDLKIMTRFSMYEGDNTSEGRPVTGGVGTTSPNSTEFSLEEPLEIVRRLKEFGVDVINVSAGIPRYNGDAWVRNAKAPKGFDPAESSTYGNYHHFMYSQAAKSLDLGIPIIASGFSIFGNQFAVVAENVVNEGYADMVGIGRQSLADPRVERLLAGDADYCVRCKGCSELLVSQAFVGCSHHDPMYGAQRDSIRLSTIVNEVNKERRS
jgi:2,4-dienoyl-CoA reductase-like NADH-dependent reductase (Old Yellow Enzyme family)